MHFRRKLRSRIVVSFILFGTLLSTLVIAAVVLTRAYVEEQMLGERLIGELQKAVVDARSEQATGQRVEPRPFSQVQAWLVRPYRLRTLPDYLKELPAGIHKLRVGELRLLAVVLKEEDIWGYYTYDLSLDDRLEQLVIGTLAGVVVILLLISLLLAIWSSKRVMLPVTDLAQRLRAMGDTGHRVPLHPYYADDEVGQLARTLDDYAERLTALVERDKEFNADVSHELRTPLAVIGSATELLLGQKDLDEKTRTRLHRIARAARQSTELTTALLHLVREQRLDHVDATCHDVVKIAKGVIDSQTPQLGRKPVSVDLVVVDPFAVRANSAAIAVVLGNLIGNAFKYTPQGTVTVTVEAPRVIVEDTGPGLPDDELQRVFQRHFRGSSASGKGSGIGLAIVQRLCDLYEWQVSISPREHGGLCAEIVFVQC